MLWCEVVTVQAGRRWGGNADELGAEAVTPAKTAPTRFSFTGRVGSGRVSLAGKRGGGKWVGGKCGAVGNGAAGKGGDGKRGQALCALRFASGSESQSPFP